MKPSVLLLVDDERTIAALVRRYVQPAGHHVEWCVDVPAAWKYLSDGKAEQQGTEESSRRSSRPHLLLLDLNLPGSSGLDLCRQLRAAPELKTLPIALFTTYDRPEEIAAGLEAGTDFLFPKDLVAQPDRWMERLEEILTHVHGQARTLSLSSTEMSGLSRAPELLIATINQTLRQRLPLLRQLGPPFLRALARRVCRRVALAGEPGAGHPPRPSSLDFRLLSSGLEFDPDYFAHHWPAPAVVEFALELAKEMNQVLGQAITEPFQATLAASFPLFFQHGRTTMTVNVPVILLVEDSPADVQIMQRAVRESGLSVELIVVHDGEEAVNYLLRQGKYAGATPGWRTPSLVLLDLNLPRLSGSEVLRRLRGNHTMHTVPVIVFSTSAAAADVREAYAAGANTYIQKPRDFGHFLEVLQTIKSYWLETALLPSCSYDNKVTS
jgi:CheY-like chemotaxis protein